MKTAHATEGAARNGPECCAQRQPHAKPCRPCRAYGRAPFRLAQESPGVRRYIKAFSLEFALEEGSAFSLVSRHGGGGEAGRELGQRLRAALPHLDELRFRQRMEMAVIFCFSALTRHARQPGAFQGPEAESYLRTLRQRALRLLSALGALVMPIDIGVFRASAPAGNACRR